MSGETLDVHLRQAFELAGEPVLDAAALDAAVTDICGLLHRRHALWQA